MQEHTPTNRLTHWHMHWISSGRCKVTIHNISGWTMQHTHTHNHFVALWILSGTTRWASTRRNIHPPTPRQCWWKFCGHTFFKIKCPIPHELTYAQPNACHVHNVMWLTVTVSLLPYYMFHQKQLTSTKVHANTVAVHSVSKFQWHHIQLLKTEMLVTHTGTVANVNSTGTIHFTVSCVYRGQLNFISHCMCCHCQCFGLYIYSNLEKCCVATASYWPDTYVTKIFVHYFHGNISALCCTYLTLLIDQSLFQAHRTNSKKKKKNIKHKIIHIRCRYTQSVVQCHCYMHESGVENHFYIYPRDCQSSADSTQWIACCWRCAHCPTYVFLNPQHMEYFFAPSISVLNHILTAKSCADCILFPTTISIRTLFCFLPKKCALSFVVFYALYTEAWT